MVFSWGCSAGLRLCTWVGADIEVDRGASWQTRWRAGGGAAAGTMLGALRALLVLFAFQLPLSSGQVDCEDSFEEIITYGTYAMGCYESDPTYYKPCTCIGDGDINAQLSSTNCAYGGTIPEALGSCTSLTSLCVARAA